MPPSSIIKPLSIKQSIANTVELLCFHLTNPSGVFFRYYGKEAFGANRGCIEEIGKVSGTESLVYCTAFLAINKPDKVKGDDLSNGKYLFFHFHLNSGNKKELEEARKEFTEIAQEFKRGVDQKGGKVDIVFGHKVHGSVSCASINDKTQGNLSMARNLVDDVFKEVGLPIESTKIEPIPSSFISIVDGKPNANGMFIWNFSRLKALLTRGVDKSTWLGVMKDQNSMGGSSK